MNFKETISWYDHNAPYYVQATVSMVQLEELISFANLVPPGGLVLDAGCGAGRDTNIFNQLGIETIGMDFSRGMIEEAKARNEELPLIHGDFEHLPFADGTFAGTWAHASLVHLETTDDVRSALIQFHRVLKSTGLLYVLVKAQIGMEKTAVVSDKLSGHDRFFQYFTREELNSLLMSSGFQVLRSEQYRESDKNPSGRPEVEWIVALARK